MADTLQAADDTALVSQLKAGRESAFEEVLRRYEKKVYSLVRGLTRNDADAQDALQETFLSVYKKIGSFKEASSLSTWIYRIAVNAALMTIRRRKRHDRTVSIDEHLPEFDGDGHRVMALPDWSPDAAGILLNKELSHYLRESIQALEPGYRTVFILRDQEGLSNEEVAAVLKLSVPAVKSRLHRARLFLRERIKKYWWGTRKPRARFSESGKGAARGR
ncbi:MAG: RNA polymerase subunit sigma [Acidobacteria bacterium]|nr:MAG: RNA polymerase subunit sigma [Acidobacteriota bacterium]